MPKNSKAIFILKMGKSLVFVVSWVNTAPPSWTGGKKNTLFIIEERSTLFHPDSWTLLILVKIEQMGWIINVLVQRIWHRYMYFFCKELNQCKNTNFSAVVHTCGCGSLFAKNYCYHTILCNVHAGAAKILFKWLWLSIKVYFNLSFFRY